jgi:hypothetical protein
VWVTREKQGQPLGVRCMVRHAGLTQREIASLFGLRCDSAVSCQLRFLPEILRTNEEVGRLQAVSERLVRKAQKR